MESEEEEEPMAIQTTPPHTLQTLPVERDMADGEPTLYHSPHQLQVSMAEYHRQAGDYTQEAVRQLKASPEYKAHTQRCLSCGSVWYEGGVGEGCGECGGYAMARPCAVCAGQCGAVWTRSVSMSHSFHEAHWNGQCSLSEEQKMAQVLKRHVQPDYNELTDAMQDLGT